MSDFDTPLTRAREAHLNAIRDEMHALAATVTNPPARVQVDDLWAHVRQHADDGEQARKLVLSAIRLGWRPMGEQA